MRVSANLAVGEGGSKNPNCSSNLKTSIYIIILLTTIDNATTASTIDTEITSSTVDNEATTSETECKFVANINFILLCSSYYYHRY